MPAASDLRPRNATARFSFRQRLLACAAAALLLLAGIVAVGGARARRSVAEETPPAANPAHAGNGSPPTPVRRNPSAHLAAKEPAPLPKQAAARPREKAHPVLRIPAGLALPTWSGMRWRQPPDGEELRKELLEVPEVSLDSVPNTSRTLLTMARARHSRGLGFAGPALLRGQRFDLAALPLRMGENCYSGLDPAETLQALSHKLRANLVACARKDGDKVWTDEAALRKLLLVEQAKDWRIPEALPTLVQMLQVEDTPIRRLLVELLGRMRGPRASAALALRAVTDLSREVREQAVRELKKRRSSEVVPVLLRMLRYPWAPAAEHAAEALVALDRKTALPQLYRMLNEPDPVLPVTGTPGAMHGPVLREVVRVNHLANCMLCHPPSLAENDLVRGAIPGTGQPATYSRGGQDSIFVRADVTYLRQDFSVVQPVADPKGGPALQRYDYLVRQRPLTPAETALRVRQFQANGRPSRQREALYFVLRELTADDRPSTPSRPIAP